MLIFTTVMSSPARNICLWARVMWAFATGEWPLNRMYLSLSFTQCQEKLTSFPCIRVSFRGRFSIACKGADCLNLSDKGICQLWLLFSFTKSTNCCKTAKQSSDLSTKTKLRNYLLFSIWGLKTMNVYLCVCIYTNQETQRRNIETCLI